MVHTAVKSLIIARELPTGAGYKLKVLSIKLVYLTPVLVTCIQITSFAQEAATHNLSDCEGKSMGSGVDDAVISGIIRNGLLFAKKLIVAEKKELK